MVDELLSRLYQHLTDQQTTRYGGGYDLAAGLDRYQAWLHGHAAGDHARPGARRARPVTVTPASGTGTGAVTAAPGPRDPTAAGPAASRPTSAPGAPKPGLARTSARR